MMKDSLPWQLDLVRTSSSLLLAAVKTTYTLKMFIAKISFDNVGARISKVANVIAIIKYFKRDQMINIFNLLEHSTAVCD